jgi:hypothetical protein
MVTALLLPFLAVMLLLTGAALEKEAVAPGEDIVLARSVEDYVSSRAGAVMQKVDSISVRKKSGSVEKGIYKSEWDVVLRYRLGYAAPEEDPFLAGMARCVSEKKAELGSEWAEWAEKEISRYRDEIQGKMTFAQESAETIAAEVEIDSGGYIDVSTIKLLVDGMSEGVSPAELLKAIPRPEVFEAAGYQYLLDPTPSKPASSSGGQGVQVGPEKRPVTRPATPAPKSPAPARSTSVSPEDANRRRLIIWVVLILGLLMAILVVSEIYNRRRK